MRFTNEILNFILAHRKKLVLNQDYIFSYISKTIIFLGRF